MAPIRDESAFVPKGRDTPALERVPAIIPHVHNRCFCLLCFALAVLCLGADLPGMAMATSRHEPPRYDQAGQGHNL
jgi:hypothetical protein